MARFTLLLIDDMRNLNVGWGPQVGRQHRLDLQMTSFGSRSCTHDTQTIINNNSINNNYPSNNNNPSSVYWVRSIGYKEYILRSLQSFIIL